MSRRYCASQGIATWSPWLPWLSARLSGAIGSVYAARSRHRQRLPPAVWLLLPSFLILCPQVPLSERRIELAGPAPEGGVLHRGLVAPVVVAQAADHVQQLAEVPHAVRGERARVVGVVLVQEPDADHVAARIAQGLLARQETVALVETAGGGLAAAALLAMAGASSWFLSAAVAYSVGAKERWLDLPPEVFAPDGVASAAGAVAMAAAVRRQLGATWGVAEAGIAGPQTGRRSSKPAGLAYLAVAGVVPLGREVRTGVDDRRANQRAFAHAALSLLLEALETADGRTDTVPATATHR